MYIYTQSTFTLASDKGLLDLLSRLGPERQSSAYTVGINAIDNVLLGQNNLNPDGRNTNNYKSPYSSTEPYLVGQNILSNKLIDGVGSIFYLSQTTVSSTGTPDALGIYFTPEDGPEGYFNTEFGSPYYNKQYQI